MRRSELRRGDKPLKATAALVRKAGLAQVGRKRREEAGTAGKPARAATATRGTGPPRLTVEAILERAQHSCERCSEAVGPVRGVDWHVHHRRPRGAGGSKRTDTNSPSNCTVLCPRCHNEIESYRAVAQSEGWILQQTNNPARVPLLIERGARFVYLTADAGYSLHPPDPDPIEASLGASEEL